MLDQTKCLFSTSFKIETTEASHSNGAFEFLPLKVSRDISCKKKYKDKILLHIQSIYVSRKIVKVHEIKQICDELPLKHNKTDKAFSAKARRCKTRNLKEQNINNDNHLCQGNFSFQKLRSSGKRTASLKILSVDSISNHLQTISILSLAFINSQTPNKKRL